MAQGYVYNILSIIYLLFHKYKVLIIYKWQKDIDIAGDLCEEQEIAKIFQLLHWNLLFFELLAF